MGVWVQSHDVVQGGNGSLQFQEGPVNEGGRAGGGASQGESIQTMHRLLTQGHHWILYIHCVLVYYTYPHKHHNGTTVIAEGG